MPGSSMYGGQAELSVINVISKSAEDINGLSAKVNFGDFCDLPDYTHRTLPLQWTKVSVIFCV